MVGVERVTNTQTCNICIRFDESMQDTFEYPSLDVERLATSKESSEHYPEKFIVGDVVDGFFQDGNRTYRGRIAVVDEDGGTCNIMYYDGDVSFLSHVNLVLMCAHAFFVVKRFSCCVSLSTSRAFQRGRRRFALFIDAIPVEVGW